MKIAHYTVFSPNQCGLYHTAKDLILGERAVGIDAGLIDFGDQGHKSGMVDGTVEAMPLEWADNADILVRHSAIPEKYQNAGIPIIAAIHGRPESSMRMEQQKKQPIITAFKAKMSDSRYKKFITFWPEYLIFWENLFHEKLAYVPAMVDLEAFRPTDPLLDWKGKPNILIADMWRDDVTPFNMFFAARHFRNYCEKARIHIIGLSKDFQSGVTPFLENEFKRDGIELIASQMKDVIRYYSSADMVITPHVIATRVMRESLACGTPVVAGSGCRYTDYTANPMDIEGFTEAIWKCWRDYNTDRIAVRKQARETAEKNFNPVASGRAMKRICEEILGVPKTRRKVFIDIGGHIGESVRRFYREVEDANQYDIYSFEPDPQTFKTLQETVGHIPNVHLINSAVGFNGKVDFYRGGLNQNEGGTTLKDKLAGKVDYDNPIKVKSVLLSQWLLENIQPDDYVIVKINAEGGEYTIMKDLLSANVECIDKLFIQLHSHKFSSPDREEYMALEEKFKKQFKTKLFYYGKKDVPLNV